MAGMGDWDLFESGRLGMIVTGIWAFPEYTSNCDFDWDIVVEPGHTQKATHFFSNGYVVSKDSQVADEAVKFITYISSNREATQIRLDAGWELPRFRTRISSLSTKKRLLRQIAKRSLRALITL